MNLTEKEGIMQKLLVISYDEDQQQPYFDHVLAADRDHAIIRMERLRPDAFIVDALVADELRKMTTALDAATEADIEAWMDQLAQEAEEDGP